MTTRRDNRTHRAEKTLVQQDAPKAKARKPKRVRAEWRKWQEVLAESISDATDSDIGWDSDIE